MHFVEVRLQSVGHHTIHELDDLVRAFSRSLCHRFMPAFRGTGCDSLGDGPVALEHELDLGLSRVKPHGDGLRSSGGSVYASSTSSERKAYDHNVEGGHDETLDPVCLSIRSDVVHEET